MNVLEELKEVLGDRLLTREEDKIPYMRDASYFAGKIPDAVAIPKTSGEISAIMKMCSSFKVPVTIRSGGSSLTGSSVPTHGGILISMSAMNRILAVKPEDSYVIAEPGVRLDDLNRELEKIGFFYPPDPASSMAATVGGTISTNAGGLRASYYGTTKEWVLGVEVVLPNGEIVEFGGKTLKRTKGYDLTALMIGNEGTLGIITRAILKIWPVPEKVGRIISYFTEITDVGRSVSELKKNGIIPHIAEFMDALSMESVRRANGISFPDNARFLLMIDIASTKESISRLLEKAREIISAFDPVSIDVTLDKDEMAKMYQARKGLYSSSLSLRTDKHQYVVIADLVVPASELPAAFTEIQEMIDKSRLKVMLFGHIGDGNIHGNIFADTRSTEEMEKVDSLQMNLAKIVLSHGGSVSAEHGIGIEKKTLLIEELRERNSEFNLKLMRSIKDNFDPQGLLNRGKIFD